MSFGKRLRSERDRLCLTQQQFAEIGGVKRLSQHLYEQDVRPPDANYLIRLSEQGVDPAFLITGVQARNIEPDASIRIEMNIAAFRAVDEFARDSFGEPLSYTERERFFRFLCSILDQGEAVDNPIELKSKLNEPK